MAMSMMPCAKISSRNHATPGPTQVKLVVKPDMLFGQRGKNDLVGLNLTFSEAEAFIRARMNKEVGGGWRVTCHQCM
jgi:succinyl-CoA synthetase beta subunit